MSFAEILKTLQPWTPRGIVTLLTLYVLYHGASILKEYLRLLWTPLRKLKGPPSPSWLAGAELLLLQSEDAALVEQYVSAFGPSFKFPSFIGQYQLCSIDPRAMGHILNNTDIYWRPNADRKMLGELLGNGVLIAEGDTHKRQRRILNPSFSPSHIREITPIFFEKAFELRDIWQECLEGTSNSDSVRLDAVPWLNRLTLDIIGLAGFGYSADTLSDEKNDLANAFATLIRSLTEMGITGLLRLWIPGFKYVLPDKDKTEKKTSMDTMRRIGLDLIGKKKTEALEIFRLRDSDKGKSGLGGRDLLSTLIHANMAPDLPEAHRLSDEEVLDQITTFMLAGHETTSNGILWALHVLSQRMDIQTKLRGELLVVKEETPSMDSLNALPYLDLFVREVLRLYAPVPGTRRVATRDDSIPLSFPIVNSSGETQDYIRVQAGDGFLIPIHAMNRSKALWGDDALEFKPERFQGPNTSPGSAAIPGVWSDTMTFLGGPRACIGYRFTIIEMKAILFTLVRAFTFEQADPSIIIGKKTRIVTRPILIGQEDKGTQLPLLLRPVNASH